MVRIHSCRCTNSRTNYPQEVLMRLRLKLLPLVVLLLLSLPAFGGKAQARPESVVKSSKALRVPRSFRVRAICVHNHEEHWSWRWSPRFHPHYSYWNHYYTGMQFAQSTWQRANGLLHSHVRATTNNATVIIRHAYVIVRQDGGSWREWPNSARECGLPTY